MKYFLYIGLTLIFTTFSHPHDLLYNTRSLPRYRAFIKQLKSGDIRPENLIEVALEQFDQLVDHLHGRRLLLHLFPGINSEQISLFIKPICRNLHTLCASYTGYQLVTYLLQQHTPLFQDVYQQIEKTFLSLQHCHLGQKLCLQIARHNSIYAQKIITLMQQHHTQLRPDLFSFLSRYITDEQEQELFYKNFHPQTITQALLYGMIHNSYTFPDRVQTCAQTPTEKHIMHNTHHIKTHFITGTNRNPLYHKYRTSRRLQHMLDQIIAKESELQDAYYTFVHGQRWSYHLTERWFTRLWELKYRKKLDDFYFLHVKKIPTDLESQAALRERLVQKGRLNHHDKKGRKHILSTNYAFFGNSTQLGSNTAQYIITNSNVGSVYATLKTAFQSHGYHHIYKKYKKELEQLEAAHAKLSNYGNIAFIAIPKNIVDRCVYLSSPGTYKHEPISITYPNGAVVTTDSVSTILETVITHPEYMNDSDEIEFALIMTADTHGGLCPDSNIKVYMFHATEPDQYQTFLEKEQLLFQAIKNDILNTKAFF